MAHQQQLTEEQVISAMIAETRENMKDRRLRGTEVAMDDLEVLLSITEQYLAKGR